MRRVLLIEDEHTMRSFLKVSLATKGWNIIEAADFSEALAVSGLFEFVIMDVDLTDRAFESHFLGFRKKSPEVPILALTIGEGQLSKADLLRMGVSDFLAKPFTFSDLLLRLQRLAEDVYSECVLSQRRNLRVDLVRKEVLMNGRKTNLSETEWNCLKVLCERAGRVVDEGVLSALAASQGPEPQLQAKMIVWNLRQKLEEDPFQPQLIKTVPGVGYRLEMSS